jgi:hypothetical protein
MSSFRTNARYFYSVLRYITAPFRYIVNHPIKAIGVVGALGTAALLVCGVIFLPAIMMPLVDIGSFILGMGTGFVGGYSLGKLFSAEPMAMLVGTIVGFIAAATAVGFVLSTLPFIATSIICLTAVGVVASVIGAAVVAAMGDLLINYVKSRNQDRRTTSLRLTSNEGSLVHTHSTRGSSVTAHLTFRARPSHLTSTRNTRELLTLRPTSSNSGGSDDLPLSPTVLSSPSPSSLLANSTLSRQMSSSAPNTPFGLFPVTSSIRKSVSLDHVPASSSAKVAPGAFSLPRTP